MFEEFAAERTQTLQNYDEALLPVVRAALKDYDAESTWYSPIVEEAADLYHETAGDSLSAEQRKQLSDTLAKTKDPENTSGSTDERVAKWVATYVVNASEHASADAGSSKTWVTMHDDRVRPAHAALDGVTIASDQRFQVGDSKLSYPGEPIGDPAEWINCRCILKVTKGAEMSTIFNDPAYQANGQTWVSGTGTTSSPYIITTTGSTSNTFRLFADQTTVVAAPDPADMPAEDPTDTPVDADVQVPFYGVATVTDTPTGDQRQLTGDGFSARPLPLPLFYQRAQGDGHEGGTIVGQLTSIERVGQEIQYAGHFNFTPEAGEAIQGVAEGWLRGVSVDLDDVVIDMAASTPKITEDMTDEEAQDAIASTLTVFKQWRVSGLTMVGIPAFYQAYIALGSRQAEAGGPDADPAVTASATFAPGTHDGPGWITHPIPTGRIRRYWVSGEGAAKIKWGVPGDFNRCRTQLAKYIQNPDWLAGACANMHKEATGGWPGHAPTEGAALQEIQERKTLVEQGALIASAFNLVAAAPRQKPPVEWFQDPGLTAPTPITIEGDRIFGHIATWGTCHIGLPGQCTTAPHSNTDYAWFRLGAVDTEDGLVPVGQITMQTGHAGLRANVKQAAAHYDNTGTAVADIATGEDDFGIWFSGRIRPGVSEDERAELLGAKLSGDWREVGGNLELVAALAVNTPGFGIPRLGLAASGQVQTSLVAAGIVETDSSTGPVQIVVDKAFMERIEKLEAAERGRRVAGLDTARLRELATARKHDRIVAARERLGRI